MGLRRENIEASGKKTSTTIRDHAKEEIRIRFEVIEQSTDITVITITREDMVCGKEHVKTRRIRV